MPSHQAGHHRAPIERRALMLGALSLSLAPLRAVGKQIVKPDPDPITSGDPQVASWVAEVSYGRLRETVAGLSAFPTRWTPSASFPLVEDWVEESFLRQSAGRLPVTRQPYNTASGLLRHNILAGQPRGGRAMILIGGHMDSLSEQPAVSAPGANDNATGIAAMLEALRILSGVAFERDVVFVAFSGEEQGLWGSTACRDIARREGWPIELMINLDMLGFRPPDPTAPIIVEYDQGNAVVANDAQAREYGQMAAEMALLHTTLTVTHTDIWASDYMPFEAVGIPCIGLYDGGAESAQYHTTSDVIGLVDFSRLEQATRLLVATIATAAGVPN